MPASFKEPAMKSSLSLLLAATVFVVAACGDAPETEVTAAPGTDSAPTATARETEDAASPAADEATDTADSTDESADAPRDDAEDRPEHTGTYPDGFTVEPEGQELALVGNDHIEVLYTLDPEGGSVFRAAAVRPGSTRDDMTVVVVTSAEGMYDLRWLEVRDGEVGDLELFPSAHRMASNIASRQDLVPTVVWSPDGNSIAWIEPGEDAALLRTVGWSYGPGTGRTADDNAGFGIEGAPAVLQAHSWDVAHSDGSQTILTADSADGGTFELRLERQTDGGWAYHGLAG